MSITAGAQKNHPIIKFSPLAALEEGNFPVIQAGVEFPLKNNLSLYSEIGIRYRKGIYDNADTIFTGSGGFKAKVELRHYITNEWRSWLEGTYWAANIFYTNSSHNTSMVYYKGNDSTTRIGDDFAVKKTVIGLNALRGWQNSYGKRFMVDAYIGVGIRFRIIDHSHLEYDRKVDRLDGARHFNVNEMRHQTDTRNGLSVAPNLTFGIRLGWRL